MDTIVAIIFLVFSFTIIMTRIFYYCFSRGLDHIEAEDHVGHDNPPLPVENLSSVFS